MISETGHGTGQISFDLPADQMAVFGHPGLDAVGAGSGSGSGSGSGKTLAFAAYIPIIGILIFSRYEQYMPDIARGAVVVCVAALVIVAAQLLAHWLLGNLPAGTLHPGYFLPAVAGAFIASMG
jgi:hypothetical protein